MSDTARTIDLHLQAYGEPDAETRASLLAEAWEEDGCLVDPPFEGTGQATISELAAGLQGHYPGHRFRRATGVDEHHGFARYEWELVAPDGTVALTGLDVAEVGEERRLRRVVGFVGPVPALEGRAAPVGRPRAASTS